MADNDCEVSVFKNGTLMRWTGEDADRITLFLSRCGFRDPDLPVRMGDLEIGPPTVTKPLRRVSLFTGHFSPLHREFHVPAVGGRTDTPSLNSTVPTIRDGDKLAYPSGMHKWRITVEAEAVEEKGR